VGGVTEIARDFQEGDSNASITPHRDRCTKPDEKEGSHDGALGSKAYKGGKHKMREAKKKKKKKRR